jgi:hypothetical protein|eukprot:g6899.t1
MKWFQVGVVVLFLLLLLAQGKMEDGSESGGGPSLLLLPLDFLEQYDNQDIDESVVFMEGLTAFEEQFDKRSLALYPVILAASVLLSGELTAKEREDTLMLVLSSYTDGEWGRVNVWHNIPKEDMYDFLPDAVDYFEVLMQQTYFDTGTRLSIATLYSDSGHVEAASRVFRYVGNEAIDRLAKAQTNVIERSATLSLLAMTLWYIEPKRPGQAEAATYYLKQATRLDPSNSEIESMYQTSVQNFELERLRKKLISWKAKDEPALNGWLEANIPRTFDKIDKIAWQDLSYETFFRDYVLTRTPVVITGLVDVMTRSENPHSREWDFEYVKRVCADMQVTKKGHVSSNMQVWAGLVDFGDTTVGEFIDHLPVAHENITASRPLPYVFDESISENCPELLKNFTVPKYFAQDLGYMMYNNGPYNGHPSLFIGPRNSKCGLHVDSSSSNFWQALLKGRKKWYFYPLDDQSSELFLYYSPMHKAFLVDPHDPDYGRFPLLQFVQEKRLVEVVVEEGEVIYVPTDTPHAVKNLDASLAFSHNYMDASNLLRVFRTLYAEEGVGDENAFWMSQLIDDDNTGKPNEMLFHRAKRVLRKHPRDLSWEEFKNATLKGYIQNGTANTDFWTSAEHQSDGDKDNRFLRFEWPGMTVSSMDLLHPVTGRVAFPGARFANMPHDSESGAGNTEEQFDESAVNGYYTP